MSFCTLALNSTNVMYDRLASTNNEIVRKSYLRSLNLQNINVSLYVLYQFYSNRGPQTGSTVITR